MPYERMPHERMPHERMPLLTLGQEDLRQDKAHFGHGRPSRSNVLLHTSHAPSDKRRRKGNDRKGGDTVHSTERR